MGLPEKNEKAYEKEAVKSHVSELKGSLLIVHGMADDNVQLQNTIEVASELQEKNEHFDLMLYHGRDHALKGGNTPLHLFKLTTEYFSRNLQGFQT
jgi:dipeptidyl-peptidase-4